MLEFLAQVRAGDQLVHLNIPRVLLEWREFEEYCRLKLGISERRVRITSQLKQDRLAQRKLMPEHCDEDSFMVLFTSRILAHGSSMRQRLSSIIGWLKFGTESSGSKEL